MATLINLAGTAATETNAVFISDANEVDKLTPETALTAAGNNGAINVWIDDEGKFRCESMRFMVSLEEQTYSDRQSVRYWIAKWLVQIGR